MGSLKFTGYKNPGTLSEDTSVGTIAWVNHSNAGSSDDAYATSLLSGTTYVGVKNNSIKLIKAGTITGTSQNNGVNWSSSDEYEQVGGQNNVWGVKRLKYTDVNATNFGWGISATLTSGTDTSYYLTATNHGFALTAGQGVVGIQGQFERKYVNTICLTGETWVSTLKGRKMIKHLKPGDVLLSFDPKTLEYTTDTVTHVVSRLSMEITKVIADGKLVEATPNHEFFVAKNKVVPIADLKVGDKVLMSGKYVKEATIQEIENIKTNIIVYDITTEKYHAYFANDFAVHNTGGGPFTFGYIDHMQLGIWYISPTSPPIPRPDGMAF